MKLGANERIKEDTIYSDHLRVAGLCVPVAVVLTDSRQVSPDCSGIVSSPWMLQFIVGGYVIGWPSFRLVLGCMRSKGGFRTLVIIGASFASAVYRSNSVEDA